MNSGRVHVYAYDENHWNQLGMNIDGEGASDYSGSYVSMSADGATIAIGALNNDGNRSNTRHVRVYSFVESEWTQLGTVEGENAGDEFGSSVSMTLQNSVSRLLQLHRTMELLVFYDCLSCWCNLHFKPYFLYYKLRSK